MPHKILTKVWAKSGLSIASNAFVKNDIKVGTDNGNQIYKNYLRFYVSQAKFTAGWPPFRAIKSDTDRADIIMFQESISEGTALTTNMVRWVNEKVSNFLSNIFGYWNVIDTDFEQLQSEIDISSNKEMTFNLPAGYDIDKIRVMNNTENNAGNVSIGLTSEATDVLNAKAANANTDETYDPESLETSGEDRDLYISSSDWGTGQVTITIKFKLA